MIERILKVRLAINKIISCHPSAPEMLNVKEIIEVCAIEITTREVCDEKYITCSKVIPLTRLLSVKVTGFQPKQPIADSFKNNLITEIKKRLLHTESAVATLLDPRFKNIHFQDAVS